jgi:hypothetical protein
MPNHTCSVDTCTCEEVGDANADYASSSATETTRGPDLWFERYARLLQPTETTDPR